MFFFQRHGGNPEQGAPAEHTPLSAYVCDMASHGRADQLSGVESQADRAGDERPRPRTRSHSLRQHEREQLPGGCRRHPDEHVHENQPEW